MSSIDDSRLHIMGSHLSSFMSVRKRSVNVQGRPVSYLETGRGAPIVLLHGFCCNKSNWRGVMSRFTLDGFRLIAPDVPGFHLAQIDPSVSYSGRFFNEWIEGFLDSLEIEKCHLVAHSVVTMQAIHFASSKSERIESLVLANMPDFLMPNAGDDGGIVEEFLNSLKYESSEAMYRHMTELYYQAPGMPKVLREYAFNTFQRKIKDADNLFDACINLRPQLLSKTGQITSPVLFIVSDHDIYAPVDFDRKVASNFKLFSSITLKKCGHMSYLEKQSDFIACIASFVERSEVSGKKVC